MAYPFPRFMKPSHVPPGIAGVESPYTTKLRKKNSTPSSTHVVLIIFATVAFLYYVCSPPRDDKRPYGNIPYSHDEISDYFAHFEGHTSCSISSPQIYIPPHLQSQSSPQQPATKYCPTRRSFLSAFSNGGRHGFDAPFQPQECQYRWYTTQEVCMIMDRFDAVVFVGDEMLKSVYAAFNMLLREDVSLGGLRTWEMSDAEKEGCRCEGQLTKPECRGRLVRNGGEYDAKGGSPYVCNRIPHMFIPIGSPPSSKETKEQYTSLLSQVKNSYRPSPLLLSIGLASVPPLSYSAATSTMDEWLALTVENNVPALWLNPTAAGHLKPPGAILTQGNNALWHYTTEMSKEAARRETDVLSLYNMTIQASSWDGTGYGLNVALVQAMGVVNWLAGLEST